METLGEKHLEFHTHKTKEERSFRVVFKNMDYSINHEDIKIEIEKI